LEQKKNIKGSGCQKQSGPASFLHQQACRGRSAVTVVPQPRKPCLSTLA
jgi:hypothetical protein